MNGTCPDLSVVKQETKVESVNVDTCCEYTCESVMAGRGFTCDEGFALKQSTTAPWSFDSNYAFGGHEEASADCLKAHCCEEPLATRGEIVCAGTTICSKTHPDRCLSTKTFRPSTKTLQYPPEQAPNWTVRMDADGNLNFAVAGIRPSFDPLARPRLAGWFAPAPPSRDTLHALSSSAALRAAGPTRGYLGLQSLTYALTKQTRIDTYGGLNYEDNPNYPDCVNVYPSSTSLDNSTFAWKLDADGFLYTNLSP